METLYDLSWKVDEKTYRDYPAISQSLISSYLREGYSALKEKQIQTKSLTFGSAVDCMLTEGTIAFSNKYIVEPEGKSPSDSIMGVLKLLYQDGYTDLETIPDNAIINRCDDYKYGLSYSDTTRINNIKKNNEYFKFYNSSQSKIILNSKMYSEVFATVSALKRTGLFNKPLNNKKEKFYQLKFKQTINDVEFKGMLDLVIVSHESKTIYPIDLKTSSNKEYDFYKSFLHWRYDIQAKLYYLLLKKAIENTEYADYKIDNFRFVVVNKDSLTPLIWKFDSSSSICNELLVTDKGTNIKFDNPIDIGIEINEILKSESNVPLGINTKTENSLEAWIIKNL